MSNQAILWGTIVIPWLSLFLMPRKDVKRFLPVGLFSAFFCIIAIDIATTKGLWEVMETGYPFTMLPSFAYGLFPIAPMWICRYTYGRFCLYFVVEVAANVGYAFVLLPWFASRGIIEYYAKELVFVYAMILSIQFYGFQMWMEGVGIFSKNTKATLQPAVFKLVDQDETDKNK